MFALVLTAATIISQSERIADNVAPIQLEGTEFSDLEPLRKAIGNSRIVQLGELTHGDGTSFLIKTRLVKFLHERAGFDVLVWESGLVEGEELSRRLRSDEPLADVATSAVFGHWSRARESFGVFEYARQTVTTRPLLMSGFDIQSSGKRGNAVFFDLAQTALDRTGEQDLDRMIARLRRMPEGPPKEDAILALAKPLGRVLGHDRLVGTEIFQKIKSFCAYNAMMESYKRFQKTKTGQEFQVGYNLREKANYENVSWLLNSRYREKKLILWAHNSHVSNLGADGDYHVPQKGEVVLDSLGRLLKANLGSEVYSVGMVASGGSWSWMGQPMIPFEAAKTGSIEAILGRAGYDFGFVDLSRARRMAPLLNAPIAGLMNRQNGQLRKLVWPDVFDGLIYIRDMKPRTEVSKT